MKSIIDLREENFAAKSWGSLRPFFCRLSPEYIWEITRNNVIEEINEELEAIKSKRFEYATFFTYPSDEQLKERHDKGGIFFSEIREMVAYRAAEALSTLSGYIRLEQSGDNLKLLTEIFENLWSEFSKYSYHRGYRTAQVRANLILILSSNNTFELIKDKSWQGSMLDYFETGSHDWSGEPLKQLNPGIIKILGGEIDNNGKTDVIIQGKVDTDALYGTDVENLASQIVWEQGAPEDDPYLPGLMMSNQRRGSSEPPSDFYYFSYHLIKFSCKSLFDLDYKQLTKPFLKSIIHYLQALDLRSLLVHQMGIKKSFRIEDVSKKCAVDNYTSVMLIGQMIKTGLIEFDKYSGLDWTHSDQEFICVKECNNLL